MIRLKYAYQEQVVEVDAENGGRVGDQREGLGAAGDCVSRKAVQRGGMSYLRTEGSVGPSEAVQRSRTPA